MSVHHIVHVSCCLVSELAQTLEQSISELDAENFIATHDVRGSLVQLYQSVLTGLQGTTGHGVRGGSLKQGVQ